MATAQESGARLPLSRQQADTAVCLAATWAVDHICRRVFYNRPIPFAAVAPFVYT